MNAFALCYGGTSPASDQTAACSLTLARLSFTTNLSPKSDMPKKANISYVAATY
jgi:hypothetical protein